MEVTTANFKDALPLFQEALESCQFLAFDCEFSGLGVSETTINEENQSLDTVYRNVKDRVGKFEIIQMGITTYHQNEKTFAYKAKTFNFYIFPAAINRFKKNSLFIFQPSAIKFLTEQSFDFNKLFYYGIPFLSKKEESLLREFRNKEALNKRDVIEVDKRGQAFLESALKDIEEWYNDPRDTGYLTIASQSAYYRRLLYQEISERYDKKIISSGSKYGVKLNKYTQEAFEKAVAFRQKRLEGELDELIGFRKIIDFIVEAEKPIVGHNLFMDLCHIMKQFILDELPETFLEFLKEVHPKFPKIYDTKYLFEAAYEFKLPSAHDSSLFALSQLISDPKFSFPEISFDFEYPKYLGRGQSSAYHEAGYDSYITGNVFIKMISKAAEDNGIKNFTWEHLKSLGFVKDHINKIYLSRGDRQQVDLSISF